MASHGYYSVIAPEGAAAIEGKIREGSKVPKELLEVCADRLKLTAKDDGLVYQASRCLRLSEVCAYLQSHPRTTNTLFTRLSDKGIIKRHSPLKAWQNLPPEWESKNKIPALHPPHIL